MCKVERRENKNGKNVVFLTFPKAFICKITVFKVT